MPIVARRGSVLVSEDENRAAHVLLKAKGDQSLLLTVKGALSSLLESYLKLSLFYLLKRKRGRPGVLLSLIVDQEADGALFLLVELEGALCFFEMLR